MRAVWCAAAAVLVFAASAPTAEASSRSGVRATVRTVSVTRVYAPGAAAYRGAAFHRAAHGGPRFGYARRGHGYGGWYGGATVASVRPARAGWDVAPPRRIGPEVVVVAPPAPRVYRERIVVAGPRPPARVIIVGPPPRVVERPW
jgi:hypothetical protein